jgi:hemerythrin-like metal-binding protein
MGMRTELLVEIFPWRDEFSVGIPEIDAQHKRMVGFINDLQAAMLSRQGDDVLRTMFEVLTEYAGTHFDLEERLMSQAGYPALARHRKEHKRFARKVVALRDKYRRSRLSISVEVLDFLRQWLDSHIMEYDHAYIGWLAPKP